MSVYITAVHMVAGGTGHEHIAEVRWEDRQTKNTNVSTRATMVDWIKNKGGDARVANGNSYVQVGVVEATPPYIRTHADGKWSDNLLALPRY
jgi:exosome complex RNA-binding protein Rrp42 (RNase PH superfamily)